MPSVVGKEISLDGLGLMRFCLPGDVTPEDKALKVLKTALNAGANVWNAADFYGTPEYNSLHLVNRYFSEYPEDAEKVVLMVKSGVVDMKTVKMDCSRAGLRGLLENALRVLDGKKTIDAFGPARVDPNVPIEESVKALAEMKAEGRIGGIQLSEVRAETIRRAASVAKIDLVEAEVNLWSQEVFENGVAEACAGLGIVLVAHTPLGAGLLTGRIQGVEDVPELYLQRGFPRFLPENIAKNVQSAEEIKKLAQVKGCTAAQLALSWVKSHNGRPGMPVILPVAGARSEERVLENVSTLDLTDDDFKKIASILEEFPVVGQRFPAHASALNEY
ncbi:aldo/keto reductase [Aspergillus steynii IBT 23096]|uniref:Aldo/keto reductase n=1 Tax=Aspergillus steynii IBT 23096 TaxID=1392250 RepID=A0A2I2FTC8_9EURO|nr:aldo/keto reductase [Aspergillus steynii IBT 23096]PLB43889.1 aldo/keto reductase [Aspergillus steynii IBT 23096]